MGKFKNTSVSRSLRNSIGDETYCEWRGIPVVKRKISANSSDTPAQQQQRARWAAGVELDALFAEASELGFPGRPREFSPGNAFTKANVNARVIEVAANPQSTGPDDKWTTTVNWEAVRCAKGRLRLPRQVTVTLSPEGDALNFTVTAEQRGPQRSEDDELYALAVETEQRDAVLQSLCTRGEGGTATLALPAGWDSSKLAVYLFMVSADGKKASDSKHVTVA